MPSLENIASVVGEAGLRHIAIEPARCVEVRHRMARCHACVETCPEGAIDVGDNRIVIQPSLCVGCGSCASECPTQALQTANPSREDLMAFVDSVADEVLGVGSGPAAGGGAGNADETGGDSAAGTGGGPAGKPAQPGGAGLGDAGGRAPYLEFACKHARAGNAAARIIVPALPYVDESVLLHAAARGFHAIALTCCNDPACLKPTRAAMPDVLFTVRSLLAAAGSDCTVSLRRQKPPAPDEDTASGKRGRRSPMRAAPAGPAPTYGSKDYSRRGMLSDLTSQAATIVAQTAAAEMRGRLGAPEAEPPTLRQALTDGRGHLRKFPMPRAQDLLDDLFVLNPEPAGAIRGRGFAQVEVNAQACRRCAMCVRFCPTGALEGEEAPIGSSALGGWHSPGGTAAETPAEGSLTFRASDCVGCHLCEAACPLRCLRVKDEVPADAIFELEPTDLLGISE